MTRVALYARYSSDNQREASIEDLAKVEGVNQTLAEQIKSSLGG